MTNTAHNQIIKIDLITHNHGDRTTMPYMTLIARISISYFGEVLGLDTKIVDYIFHVYIFHLELVVYVSFGFPFLFIACYMALANMSHMHWMHHPLPSIFFNMKRG